MAPGGMPVSYTHLCDGVCGAAILQKTLKALGIAPKLYIPDRQTEGYGTNAAAFERLIEQGVSLILTVDCGIRSVSDVALAKGRGVDCIIIDHHECGELPDTPYLLNCKMPGEMCIRDRSCRLQRLGGQLFCSFCG